MFRAPENELHVNDMKMFPPTVVAQQQEAGKKLPGEFSEDSMGETTKEETSTGQTPSVHGASAVLGRGALQRQGNKTQTISEIDYTSTAAPKEGAAQVFFPTTGNGKEKMEIEVETGTVAASDKNVVLQFEKDVRHVGEMDKVTSAPTDLNNQSKAAGTSTGDVEMKILPQLCESVCTPTGAALSSEAKISKGNEATSTNRGEDYRVNKVMPCPSERVALPLETSRTETTGGFTIPAQEAPAPAGGDKYKYKMVGATATFNEGQQQVGLGNDVAVSTCDEVLATTTAGRNGENKQDHYRDSEVLVVDNNLLNIGTSSAHRSARRHHQELLRDEVPSIREQDHDEHLGCSNSKVQIGLGFFNPARKKKKANTISPRDEQQKDRNTDHHDRRFLLHFASKKQEEEEEPIRFDVRLNIKERSEEIKNTTSASSTKKATFRPLLPLTTTPSTSASKLEPESLDGKAAKAVEVSTSARFRTMKPLHTTTSSEDVVERQGLISTAPLEVLSSPPEKSLLGAFGDFLAAPKVLGSCSKNSPPKMNKPQHLLPGVRGGPDAGRAEEPVLEAAANYARVAAGAEEEFSKEVRCGDKEEGGSSVRSAAPEIGASKGSILLPGEKKSEVMNFCTEKVLVAHQAATRTTSAEMDKSETPRNKMEDGYNYLAHDLGSTATSAALLEESSPSRPTTSNVAAGTKIRSTVAGRGPNSVLSELPAAGLREEVVAQERTSGNENFENEENTRSFRQQENKTRTSFSAHPSTQLVGEVNSSFELLKRRREEAELASASFFAQNELGKKIHDSGVELQVRRTEGVLTASGAGTQYELSDKLDTNGGRLLVPMVVTSARAADATAAAEFSQAEKFVPESRPI
ncbi:unnamed protein product, partial [Amoebophrya sp. A120]|eukprot:GSA120T00022855001.1